MKKIEIECCENCHRPLSDVPWQIMPTLGYDEPEEIKCSKCGMVGCTECMPDGLCEDCE
jgi:hypothetical protein